MAGCFLRALRAVDRAPAAERIKESPCPAKSCRKVAEGARSVQHVQRKVPSRKSLLPQFAPEYVHRVVAKCDRLGKSDVWEKIGPGLLHGSGRGFCIGERCFVLRVLLQRHVYRLLKCELRGLLCFLSEEQSRHRQQKDGDSHKVSKNIGYPAQLHPYS